MKQLLPIPPTFFRFLFLYVAGAMLWCLPGCRRAGTITSVADYVAYCNDPANGLVQVQEQDGLKLTVKYLPPAYLAYLELYKGSASFGALDSLSAQYRQSPTFQLIIESADAAVPLEELIFREAATPTDFTQHQTTLTYGMEEYVRLAVGGKKIAPVLSTLESTVENDRKLSLLFVFNSDNDPAFSFNKGEPVNFSLARNFFLGSNALFAFQADDLNQLPSLHLTE